MLACGGRRGSGTASAPGFPNRTRRRDAARLRRPQPTVRCGTVLVRTRLCW